MTAKGTHILRSPASNCKKQCVLASCTALYTGIQRWYVSNMNLTLNFRNGFVFRADFLAAHGPEFSSLVFQTLSIYTDKSSVAVVLRCLTTALADLAFIKTFASAYVKSVVTGKTMVQLSTSTACFTLVRWGCLLLSALQVRKRLKSLLKQLLIRVILLYCLAHDGCYCMPFTNGRLECVVPILGQHSKSVRCNCQDFLFFIITIAWHHMHPRSKNAQIFNLHYFGWISSC